MILYPPSTTEVFLRVAFADFSGTKRRRVWFEAPKVRAAHSIDRRKEQQKARRPIHVAQSEEKQRVRKLEGVAGRVGDAVDPGELVRRPKLDDADEENCSGSDLVKNRFGDETHDHHRAPPGGGC
eukprot:CAMPEP_0185760154 /NCGR_PEP_ID=MMETSP1174-20130828/19007_1 /TAXON_ID=35687 /ORGANISM="Dictyocha speculum, Strain CCMP1381" /LENGTH=124 /DNA_ID=CAMNT_0028440845 /DNA_START=224 /DNA_END=598 /DNA_ORIENTATION=-